MRTAIALLAAVTFTAVAAAPAVAADDAKVKSVTSQTEAGAKKIGERAKESGKPGVRGLGLFVVIVLAAAGRI